MAELSQDRVISFWKICREQVLSVMDAVISYYKENAKPQERIGRLIDRIGIDGLREFAEQTKH